MRRLVWAKVGIDVDGDKCGPMCAFRQFGYIRGYIGACCSLYNYAKVHDRRAPACVRAEKTMRRRP